MKAALALVAVGVFEGFGQQLSQEIVESAPGFARATWDVVRRSFEGGSGSPEIWGRYNKDGLAPSQSLRSLAAGAHFSDEDGNLRAIVVHDVVDGRRLELPAIVQIGLNFLMRMEAGDKGKLLGPPEGIHEEDFRNRMVALRPGYAILHYDVFEGPDAYLNVPGKYEVANRFGETMRISWTPAYPRTASRSTLLVQKGLVAAGGTEDWDISERIFLSHQLLFGEAQSKG